MKQSIQWASLSLLLLGVGCSSNQSMTDLGCKPSPEVMKSDNTFFKKITVSNMTEIESSKLALAQSQNPDIKGFAQHMITDHDAASAKVATLAAEKQVELPTKLDDDHQKMIDDLKARTGNDFDKGYIDLQVAAHKETIAFDNDEANNGSDPKIRALASKLQDTLNMHLRMAEELQSSK